MPTRGTRVNKSELIDAVAESADISKVAASRAVDALVDSITKALRNNDQVTLVGFGTFSVRQREARSGRNPQTGATIEIKAAKIPTFKAGKGRMDAVQLRPALRVLSSAGRASPLHGECRGFDPLSTHLYKLKFGVVVQPVRIPACHARGRGFESRPLRHIC